MPQINVYVQHPTGPRRVTSVEAQRFQETPNHLHLDDRCGRTISSAVAVDGNINANPFILEVDGVAYQGCTVVGRGSEYKIMFLTKGGLNDPPPEEF